MQHTAAIPWERETLEKLLLAELRERRAARRWRILLGLLFIAALLVPFLLDRMDRSISGGGTPHTAMVRIHGVIMDGEDASAEYVLPALRDALENKSSKALMLHINSPGGSAVQAGMIVDELRRLKKLHKKPIHAVVEDTCASAAYYIASAADNIYVDKASLVGSIGVLIDSFGFTGAMDKLGVERRLITAGDNKGFLDPFSPMSETQLAYAQQLTGQIHQQFIKVVREGRGERLKETPDMYSGIIWTGEQSLALGLADAYGSMESVARDIVKAEDIVDYTHKIDFAERFARQLAGAISRTTIGTALRAPQVR
ncbi:MAG: S49 family peptidase [Ottowia sp.]|nr:S49 family peptidase [Ottowia sp.]